MKEYILLNYETKNFHIGTKVQIDNYIREHHLTLDDFTVYTWPDNLPVEVRPQLEPILKLIPEEEKTDPEENLRESKQSKTN